MSSENSPACITYQYALKAYDVTLAAHVRVGERANKLIIVQALLFAALSFGLTSLGWIADHPPTVTPQGFWVWYSISTLVGLSAAAVLSISFFAALQCQRLEQLHVPSTRWIETHARKPYFRKWSNEKLFVSFSLNVRKALEQNLAGQPAVETCARRLNWSLLASFVLVVIFLGMTTGQRVVLSLSNSPRQLNEDSTMSGNKETTDDQDNQTPPAGDDQDNQTPPSEDDIIEEPDLVIGELQFRELQAKSDRESPTPRGKAAAKDGGAAAEGEG